MVWRSQAVVSWDLHGLPTASVDRATRPLHENQDCYEAAIGLGIVDAIPGHRQMTGTLRLQDPGYGLQAEACGLTLVGGPSASGGWGTRLALVAVRLGNRVPQV